MLLMLHLPPSIILDICGTNPLPTRGQFHKLFCALCWPFAPYTNSYFTKKLLKRWARAQTVWRRAQNSFLNQAQNDTNNYFLFKTFKLTFLFVIISGWESGSHSGLLSRTKSVRSGRIFFVNMCQKYYSNFVTFKWLLTYDLQNPKMIFLKNKRKTNDFQSREC